ncbi:GTP pyrophosphokinase [Burkholderia gladioli]|uniref:GTP pyrophosphokinase n=1 Tax=Burkholderia gladioli TaxID=28095 RepID=UPI001C223D9D|nr:hypothetical protein [Burkholderia gladioli]MBU9176926.1 hypothetical protein [Burkholderia gladioli]
MIDSSLKNLESDYRLTAPDAQRLKDALLDQFSHLFAENDIAIGVPMEARVKSWNSIEEKLERKQTALSSVKDLDDLIGVRVVLLFLRDIEQIDRLISSKFEVLQSEDTGTRLADAQFGYHSRHYIVRIPGAWQDVPTFSGLDKLKAEIQVRTLAQHIWAAASHKLQYKREDSVPPPVRRAIYRVSALLETVDLEFERVLNERTTYVERSASTTQPNEPLNVDLAASILAEMLPPENRSDFEDYDGLVADLLYLNIRSADELKSLLDKHLSAVMQKERNHVISRMQDNNLPGTTPDRLARNVYFTHTGLARTAIAEEFGDDKIIELYQKRQERKKHYG